MKIKLILTTALLCGLFSSLSWANTSVYFNNNTGDSTCDKITLWYSGITTSGSHYNDTVDLINKQNVNLGYSFSSFYFLSNSINVNDCGIGTPKIDSSCTSNMSNPNQINVTLSGKPGNGMVTCTH